MKQYVAYIDKYLPANHDDYSQILSETGSVKFEVFIQWWRVALGWNEIAFEKEKKEHLKKRRELMLS